VPENSVKDVIKWGKIQSTLFSYDRIRKTSSIVKFFNNNNNNNSL